VLVACFACAWFSAESERYRLIHVTAGYSVGGLIVFRLIWGLVGSRTARFADFVRGPNEVYRYLRAMIHGDPPHFVGHNPAGGWAILGLLTLGALTVLTGWISYEELSGWSIGEWHEAIASTMLALIGVHIAAVILSSWLHGENLVRAMITGNKLILPTQGIGRAWHGVGIVLGLSVLGFWIWQFVARPV